MKISPLNIIFLLIFLFIVSCVEEENPYILPYTRVYFQIDVNGIDSDLTHFSHKTFTKPRTAGEFVGYGGLLLFRSAEGAVFAYDLACPNEKDRSIHVIPGNTGKAECPVCKSVYVTMYGLGSVESGPSGNSLQKYRVEKKSGNGVFVVVN